MITHTIIPSHSATKNSGIGYIVLINRPFKVKATKLVPT